MLEDPFSEPEDEAPARRRFMAWLAVFIGLVIAAAVVVAHAAPIFKSENRNGTPIVLKLREEPCTNAAVLTHLHAKGVPVSYIAKFQAATLTWEGKDWASCWVNVEGVIYSMDEEGSPLQPVPRELFQEEGV